MYVEVKNTLGLEVAENTALELLEETYTGSWDEALSTEALRMLDSCESNVDDQMGSDEDASAANPAPSTTTAPVETESPAPEPTMTERVEERSGHGEYSDPDYREDRAEGILADLAAQADDVLGPLETKRRNQVRRSRRSRASRSRCHGFVRLAVEGPSRWDVRDEISIDGSPMKLSTPGDVDGDGEPEILVDWMHRRERLVPASCTGSRPTVRGWPRFLSLKKSFASRWVTTASPR